MSDQPWPSESHLKKKNGRKNRENLLFSKNFPRDFPKPNHYILRSSNHVLQVFTNCRNCRQNPQFCHYTIYYMTHLNPLLGWKFAIKNPLYRESTVLSCTSGEYGRFYYSGRYLVTPLCVMESQPKGTFLKVPWRYSFPKILILLYLCREDIWIINMLERCIFRCIFLRYNLPRIHPTFKSTTIISSEMLLGILAVSLSRSHPKPSHQLQLTVDIAHFSELLKLFLQGCWRPFDFGAMTAIWKPIC